MATEDVVKAQEQCSYTDQSKTTGTLLNGTDCKKNLLDSSSTKSFIPKQYYFRKKSLHELPMLNSKAKVIQIGNRASVNILLIIPTIITVQGHMFEIYI